MRVAGEGEGAEYLHPEGDTAGGGPLFFGQPAQEYLADHYGDDDSANKIDRHFERGVLFCIGWRLTALEGNLAVVVLEKYTVGPPQPEKRDWKHGQEKKPADRVNTNYIFHALSPEEKSLIQSVIQIGWAGKLPAFSTSTAIAKYEKNRPHKAGGDFTGLRTKTSCAQYPD